MPSAKRADCDHAAWEGRRILGAFRKNNWPPENYLVCPGIVRGCVCQGLTLLPLDRKLLPVALDPTSIKK